MASKDKKGKRSKRDKKRAKALTASNADRHELYERSVQAVDSEIDFVDETFTALRGRQASRLREDFCGTGNTSCEWVRRRPGNYAVGVDLDADVMAWGREHHVAKLAEDAGERIALVQDNVLTADVVDQDIVLAMNFSYMIFRERTVLRDYFSRVHESLNDDGIFFLDAFGGYDAFRVVKEHTEYDDFRYTWDQASYNPISGDMLCHIHFKFNDGSRLKRAFTYEWRMWTLPELQEILTEAGFANVTIYWQGWDDSGEEADGEFYPATEAEPDAGWICYIVAER